MVAVEVVVGGGPVLEGGVGVGVEGWEGVGFEVVVEGCGWGVQSGSLCSPAGSPHDKSADMF